MLHNDYLSCGQYENQPKHPISKEFSVFTDAKTGKYYFALVDNTGKVLFRSEAYENEKARENGMKSILTNLPEAKRYAVVSEGGQFYVTLKAGNRQEIGRSCPFATETEAKAFITRMSGKTPLVAPVAKKVAAPKVEKKAPVAKKEVVAKPAAPKVEKVVKPIVIKAVKTIVTKETKKAAPKAEYNVQSFYLGHETLTFGNIQTGYTKFVGNDGNYYFAVYNPDGSLYLGSVGYPLEEVRDQVFLSVVQSIESGENYSVVESGNAFYCVLSDAQGRELARSGAFGSFTEAFKNTPNGRVRAEVSLY